MHPVQTAVACSEYLPCLQMGWLVRPLSRVAVEGPPLEGLLWQTGAGVREALCVAAHCITVAPARLMLGSRAYCARLPLCPCCCVKIGSACCHCLA